MERMERKAKSTKPQPSKMKMNKTTRKANRQPHIVIDNLNQQMLWLANEQ